MEHNKKSTFDPATLIGTRNIFLFILGVICVFGIIMVLSASFGYSRDVYGTSFHYFYRQLIFMLLGSGVAFLISRTKMKMWFKYAEYLNWIAIVAIVLTFVPVIGVKAKGAHRWLNFGLKVQPGEFVKYSIVIPAIYYFDKFSDRTIEQRLKMAIPLSAPLLLLLVQPDFGTFAICSLIMLFVAMMSPMPRKYFYTGFGGIVIFGSLTLVAAPYRVRRLLAFLDPWKNPQGDSFQLIQSLQAFAGGGFFGKGLGNSVEKLHYLPEAHNDFIFSIIGEEFGFIGILLIVGLFLIFLFFGFRLAVMVRDKMSRFLISSIVFLIGIQAFFNMGVVMGVLPTKGLNLPFISYGGSSLLANFVGIGLILSAIRYENFQESFHRGVRPNNSENNSLRNKLNRY
ncbi:MAG: putative lipid II flippase FtsW [Bacteriovoracaceae bacterium]|nr:putative lipid II flippase FtsW [Bacteriovoracaceae bacterium]